MRHTLDHALNGIRQDIASSRAVYLYGAGIVAYGIAEALKSVWGISIAAYIVSDQHDQATSAYCGKRLLSLAELPPRMPGALILIATPEPYHEEIARKLAHRAYRYHALGYRLVHALMGEYYRTQCRFLGIEDLDTPPSGQVAKASPEDKTFKVFMAISAKDKPLRQSHVLPARVIRVQAGAAIASRMPGADAYDDEGESISRQNADYAELTVTYWAWKNQRATYKGICHYRRILDLSAASLRVIQEANIDAILPYPYLCYGDTAFQYRRYIAAEDVRILMQSLPENDREAAEGILRGKCLYNHNIVLAKEKVFNDYCQWMFPILERAGACRRSQGRGGDRCLGYLGELLTSVYFTMHRKELSIAHAPEWWMV